MFQYSEMPQAVRGSLSIAVMHAALMPTMHQFAESLGNAVDAKDPCTCEHSEDVAEVGRILALAMGLTREEADMVHLAGHLHDIGKIGVPDRILAKPGPLTALEWESMKLHPATGAAIVRPVKALAARGGVADMILAHHERWDGSGYPSGLRGEEIPLGARIIAVADSLSAMTQPRPYKPAKPYGESAHEIVSQSGRLYDPAVVTAFIRSCRAVRGALSGRTDCRGDVPGNQCGGCP